VSSRLDANSFVLKVVGKEEYFLKEVPIIQYKVGVSGAGRCPVWALELSVQCLVLCLHPWLQYVASCIAKKVQPRFSLKLYDDLLPREKEEFIRPLHAGPQQESAGHYGRAPLLLPSSFSACPIMTCGFS